MIQSFLQKIAQVLEGNFEVNLIKIINDTKIIFQVTENGDYEKLLASVKFPIWDYDYDGLISNLKLILKDSGVKDRWQIPDSNLDSFLLSIRSNYQGMTSNDLP